MKEKLRDLVADDRPIKERLLLALHAAVFFAFTLLIFAPYDLYMSNATELWFPFARIWWCFALLFAAALFVLLALSLPLSGKLFNLYVTLLFSAALLLYLQGNFLNISYGALDGSDIRWERYGAYSLVNTAVALFILLVPFIVLYFSKKFWRNMLRFVSAGLVLVQIVSLVSYALIAKPKPTEGDYGLGWDGVLSVSQEENVIVILLDTFDNKLVGPLLADDPACLDFLDGFTYYRNTLGTYKFTYPSMTAHMTGVLWFCDGTYADRTAYLRHAWESDELFTELHDLGYDSRVLGAWQYLGEARPDLIDNYEYDPKIVTSYRGLTETMLKLVAFTYLPHVLKPGFWLYTGEFNAYKQLSIYQLLDPITYRRFVDERIRADSGEKTFRMYHLDGMHLPYTLSADVTRVPESESSMFIQSKGVLKFTREIIDQLKETGAYDASTIIIMADHGTVYNDLPTETHNPVLFIKPKDAHGALATSDAPAWLMDLKATILDAAGLPNYGDYGTSVFDLTGDTSRERYFYCTHQADNNGASMTEFLVTGDCNDLSNWKKTGRTWSSTGEEIDEE